MPSYAGKAIIRTEKYITPYYNNVLTALFLDERLITRFTIENVAIHGLTMCLERKLQQPTGIPDIDKPIARQLLKLMKQLNYK